VRKLSAGGLDTWSKVGGGKMFTPRLATQSEPARTDGIELQARSAWLITVRDGKETSLTLYQTKQEALDAAGLRD
jgi:hypothetical protein